jgi:hypothetical protein
MQAGHDTMARGGSLMTLLGAVDAVPIWSVALGAVGAAAIIAALIDLQRPRAKP